MRIINNNNNINDVSIEAQKNTNESMNDTCDSLTKNNSTEDLTSKIEKFKQNNLSTFKKCLDTNSIDFDVLTNTNKKEEKINETILDEVKLTSSLSNDIIQVTKINIEKAKQAAVLISSSTKSKIHNIPLDPSPEYTCTDPRLPKQDVRPVLFKYVSYDGIKNSNNKQSNTNSASNSPRPNQTNKIQKSEKSSPSHSRSPSNSSSPSILNQKSSDEIDTVDERIKRLDELLNKHEKNQLPHYVQKSNSTFSSPSAPPLILTSIKSTISNTISSPSPQTPTTTKTSLLSTKIFDLDEKRLNSLASQATLSTNRFLMSPSCSSIASSSFSVNTNTAQNQSTINTNDHLSPYNLLKVNQSPNFIVNKQLSNDIPKSNISPSIQSKPVELSINTNLPIKEPETNTLSVSPNINTSPTIENSKQRAEKLGLKIKAPPSKLNLSSNEIPQANEQSEKLSNETSLEPLTPQPVKNTTQPVVIKRTFSCTEQSTSVEPKSISQIQNDNSSESAGQVTPLKKQKLDNESFKAVHTPSIKLESKPVVSRIEPTKSEIKTDDKITTTDKLSKIPKIKPTSVVKPPGDNSSNVSKKTVNNPTVKTDSKIIKPQVNNTTINQDTPAKKSNDGTKVLNKAEIKQSLVQSTTSSGKINTEKKSENENKKKIDDTIGKKKDDQKTKEKESNKKNNDNNLLNSKSKLNEKSIKSKINVLGSKINPTDDLYDSEDSNHTIKSNSTTNTDINNKNKKEFKNGNDKVKEKDFNKKQLIKSAESKIPVRKENKEPKEIQMKEEQKKVDAKKESIKKLDKTDLIKSSNSNKIATSDKSTKVNGNFNESTNGKKEELKLKKTNKINDNQQKLKHHKIESSDEDDDDDDNEDDNDSSGSESQSDNTGMNFN